MQMQSTCTTQIENTFCTVLLILLPRQHLLVASKILLILCKQILVLLIQVKIRLGA